jgi:F-type H+-transporting ATPase subunit b
MLQDPEFWVALSFVLFVFAVFKPVGKVLTSALDTRSAKIKKQLDDAHRLIEEAESLLASYKRRQNEASAEALKIVKNAEDEARRIVSQAEQNLEESLNKKIQVAMHKIATYEHAVVQEIRMNAIDLSVKTVRDILQEKLSNTASEEIVARAITQMNKKLGQSLN